MDTRAVVRPSEPQEDEGAAPTRIDEPESEAATGDGEETDPVVEPIVDGDEEPDLPVEPEQEEEVGNGSSAATVAASIVFVSPGATLVSNPVTLSVSATGAIYRVEYWSDGSALIGLGTSPISGFAAIFTFWMVGERQLEARAFNSGGQLVAVDTMTFTVPAQEAPASSPPPSPPPSSEPASSGGEAPAGSGSESATCAAGKILDCVGHCAEPEWINDGFCDDGTQYTIDFTCPELGMDGGDCGLQGQSPCEVGKILDCVGQCAKPEWIDDGICDDGTEYKFVLTCPELGMDGDDCDDAASSSGSPAPTPPAQPGGAVPYFYQYANDLHPSASCQNTSIAMLLAHFGWGGEPDDITAAWGKNHAQSPAGLAQVFNSYAQGMGIPQRLVAHTGGSIAGLQSLLAQGKPTIVHGYFTGYGHVLLATGYNGATYTVNDPAGQWSQTFKGGYPYGWSSTVGAGIVYGAAAFEQAVSTLNGATYAPLWYHELTP